MKILIITFILILWTETLAHQSPEPGPEYADVVFLVDSSDELGIKSLPFVRTFITKMINSLPIGTNKYRVALAQYSNTLYNAFELSKFKTKNPMLNSVKNNFVFLGGSLHIGNALREAHRIYFSGSSNGRDKKQFPPILVVLASGESQDDVEVAAQALKKDGVRIISIGTQKASEEDLRAMATASFHYKLRTIRDLSTFSSNMTQIISDATKYKEDTAKDDKIVPLSRVCQRNSVADIVFLVDTSVGSMQNLRHLQNFLRSIATSLDVSNNCIQLGLVSYSNRAEVVSFLKSSATKSEFLQQIEKLSVQAGRSNAGTALETLRLEAFSESNGSRRKQGVPQLAVVITHRPSDQSVRELALNLRLEGISVFALSIQGANNTQLEEIASYPPEEMVSKLKTYADLEPYNKNFLKKIQNKIWFQISARAKHRDIEKTGCKDTKEADIYFLIDGSSSIQSTHFRQIKIFMSDMIQMFTIGPDKVRVGVVQYSHIIEEEFDVGDYSTEMDLQKAIYNMRQLKGSSITGAALNFMLEKIMKGRTQRSIQVPQYLIVLTSGKFADRVLEPAKNLRANHITVHAIGIGNAQKTQLQQIAGVEEKVHFGQNIDSLQRIKDEIVYRICAEKGVIIFSVGTYGAKQQELEEISGDSSRVFYVENFDHLESIEKQLIFQVCALHDCKDMDMLDIVFVLDQSSSINPDQQKSMINLTIHLVNRANVGRDRVQFGALKYSDNPEVIFHLNKYSSKSDIIDNLMQYKSSGGNTYTAKALNYSNMMFTEEYGSRIKRNVKQILIIITDGVSHDKTELNSTALRLRDRGITIYAVGVKDAKQDELEAMAGDKKKAIHVSDFKELEKIYQRLQEELCEVSSEVCDGVADVIFLCDNSREVSATEFSEIKTLLSNLPDMFDLQSKKIKIGVALFESHYSEIINLSDSLTKALWIAKIQSQKETNFDFDIHAVLNQVAYMFDKGGRREAGVPQTLVVISSRPPNKNISEAVQRFKDLKIRILVLGVGNHPKDQFLPLTGDFDKITVLENFDQLNVVEHKKRIVREICQPVKPSECTMNVVVGFDISTHVPGQRLLDGHPRLESALPDILEEISSISGVSCGGGSEMQVAMAFNVNSDQQDPAKFFIYQKNLFNRLLLPATVAGPSYLNVQFLRSLWNMFGNISSSQGQVLLIFSDGLGDENAMMLEQYSDELRAAGLDALLVVSLNTAVHEDFSYFEFGKGFDYRTHLNIEMSDVGTMLARFLGNTAERICCCVFCKCVGPRGDRGIPGQQLEKGLPGLKGSRGHRGEDGDPGTRGEIGPTGEKGTAGCSGERGPKGIRGMTGHKGEPGEHGIDGVDGEDGFHGLPGVKGERGDPGSEGSPGSRGPPGVRGEKGFPGNPGQPGRDSPIKGQKGSKGEQGRQGRTGQKGAKGSPNSRGIRGREGQRGSPGAQGEPGNPGPKGELGAEGLQGPQGIRGPPGRKGEKGAHGHKGPQGPPGSAGLKGSIGSPGALGKKGEPGALGSPGPLGQMGQRGKQGDDGIPRYGQMGRKGIKGPRGFSGEMGEKGSVGEPGTPGVPGHKGFKGRTHLTGSKGEEGSRGSPGPPGRKGPKGMPGVSAYSLCELIQFMRNTSSCWRERCPVYPTELVFALDQSIDNEESRFKEMCDHIISIVESLHTRTNNCPVGARVVVVSYGLHTHYLIRQFDYHSKKQLLQLLSQIKYQPPTGPQDIGSSMRFVARNVFKRTPAGVNVRRVAVFFSNARNVRMSSIITATMEFSGLDISLAVIALNERIFFQAFEFDDTGMFQVIPSSPGLEYTLERLQRCTLCYDKCFPNPCTRETVLPEDSFMDVAFLLDNSRNIASDEFKALKTLMISILDNFKIASNPSSPRSRGDRIALLSYSPWARSSAINIEFNFTALSSQDQMKNHIQNNLRQLNGEENIGYALRWSMMNLFPSTPNLRKHKVFFVVSAGENLERKDALRRTALKAKCQGYVIFVISLGSTPVDYMEELASYPPDHHLIQLGKIHKPELDYVVRFLKPFVYSVRRQFNKYPPQMLEDDCRRESERGDYDRFFTPEPPEISSGESSSFVQELSAERNLPFVLEDNGSNRLVYIPNHMVMPQELMIKYEKDQNSEEMSSLHSELENHDREELGAVPLQDYYMDVAFLLDASHGIGNDDFKEVIDFIISVLDYFHISPNPLFSNLGDRVAVLSYSPPGYMPNTDECPAYLEFDLLTYNSKYQMKNHLQNSVQKLNGDVFIGHALQWTIDNVFVGTPNLKKNKVIFVISAGETHPSDKEVLRNVSLRAKCQGYTIFVFSFGPTHNYQELEELASYPLDHHLVQLGRIHKPDWNYIIKFVKPFVHLIRSATNKYPPEHLRPKCVNILSRTPEDIGTENNVYFIPGMYEVQTENSELYDEFDSQEQHFLLLENDDSNGPETTNDLIQKLYMFLKTGEQMMKHKESQSEEIAAPGNDKQ
ncbi:collagen alpha-5(VI) chain [Sorex araneus]|uniref:collagen alpha-5(VI) chain n=1 Tax=Sorex araneus TaxID=42254 RepID=UPI002433BDA4|nr:collagen alpha-5(VI) chain [Sorex araneus]